MAPRSSATLMRRQATNATEACGCINLDELDYLASITIENDVKEPQPDAGQPSSVAAMPFSNTDVVVHNSNEVVPTEVSIVPLHTPFTFY